ncbi:Hint domain-containing protein [Jannaschia sp. S6380]|uniref:Hint domain-containing protein n=1 Tax=Jannaschia sp. S6380 TaxID=2926408 RepID=UPI001FF4F6A3|nr:Hint domain-containing protein [Jannaschia sp. S6380]MCK0169070.1 Hint domain-containing protein [Jannaschia sp. S6380]
MTTPVPSLAVLSRCPVYLAADLTVEIGAMAGDAIGDMGQVVTGDVYVLQSDARMMELVLTLRDGVSIVGDESSVGQPGQVVHALARHQVMGERGGAFELLVLAIEGRRLVLPLGALSSADEYTLIASRPAAAELAQVSQVSFTRGTHVTLADGRQSPVENVGAGERVLTRDHGPQPVRWCGTQTTGDKGTHPVVVIAAGALNNARELVLSPDHRLFIQQRGEAVGPGRTDMLVRARHLVNGDTITWGEVGNFDFFQLRFDAHEIIYVEGIAAESLLVTPHALVGPDEAPRRDPRQECAGTARMPHSGPERQTSDPVGLYATGMSPRTMRG